MLRNLFILTFSILLLFNPFTSQEISAQPNADESKWIRSDLQTADVVVHIEAKEIKLIDSLGDSDCKKNTGTGYCQYLITADVKEFFKGNNYQNKIEFYVSADASFPKQVLLGEQVVFLVTGKNKKTNERVLTTIENSTRDVGAIKAIRKILDPNAPIDDDDEKNPYSMKSLKRDFDRSYGVLLVDVQSFKKATVNLSPHNFEVYAHIKGVFKGDFEVEQKLYYRDDLFYRPFRKEDLGRQIVFIEKDRTSGEVFFTRIRYTAREIQNDVLEKLKKIADQRRADIPVR